MLKGFRLQIAEKEAARPGEALPPGRPSVEKEAAEKEAAPPGGALPRRGPSVEAIRPDFAARRAFYASPLAARLLDAVRGTSRLVLEGEGGRFAAVLTFFPSLEDALAYEERATPLRAELDAATASFGEFRPLHDLRGVVLGAIRVDAPTVGAPALVGVGRAEPPPAVPGQQTLFLARLRGSDGTEVLVHVGSASPRDRWAGADFFAHGVVAHVDRGDAMP